MPPTLPGWQRGSRPLAAGTPSPGGREPVPQGPGGTVPCVRAFDETCEAAANPAMPRDTLKTLRFLHLPERKDAVAVTQQVRDGLSSEGRYGLTTPGVNRLAHVRSG